MNVTGNLTRYICINVEAEADPEKLRHAQNSMVQPQPEYEVCIFL